MTRRHILPLAALALLAACSQTPTAQIDMPTARFDGGIYAGSGNVVDGPNTVGSGNAVGGIFGGSGNFTPSYDTVDIPPTDSTGATRGGNTMGSGN